MHNLQVLGNQFHIFEKDSWQVLIMKDWDADKEVYEVKMVVQLDEGVHISPAFGFNEESDRDKAFEDLKSRKAEEIPAIVHELCKSIDCVPVW